MIEGHLPGLAAVGVGCVDQAEVDARLDQFLDRLAQLLRAGSAPVQVAEIAGEMQNLLPLLHVVEKRLPLVDRLHRIDMLGRRLDKRFQRLVDGIDGTIVKTLIEDDRIEVGQEINAHLLMRRRLGGTVGQLLDLLLGDLKGVRVRPLIGKVIAHARRVVEDDDMRRTLSGRHGPDKTRDKEPGQEDQQAAQQQQNKLFDDEPAAVALLRLEQELHRRPANALEAHAVN